MSYYVRIIDAFDGKVKAEFKFCNADDAMSFAETAAKTYNGYAHAIEAVIVIENKEED